MQRPEENNNFVNVTYNLYKTLQVRPPCTEDDLTKAYKRLALKYHPDKSGGNDSERFEKISAAYTFLKDPVKREFYDRFGDSGVENILKGGEAGGGSRLGDTSTFIGKFTLKVLARPVRLIPLFLGVASVGILFILFLNMLDRKLYAAELKDYSWSFIFSFLWIDEGLFAILFGYFFYSLLTNFKSFVQMEEMVEFEHLPDRRRAFLAKVKTISFLFTTLIGCFGILLALYQQYLMATNMDNTSGKLINGITWSIILYPAFILLILFSVFRFLAEIIMSLRYDTWKLRSLKIFSSLCRSTFLILFLHYFSLWLDSSDRSRSLYSLFKIFSLLYLAIVARCVAFNIEARWAIKKKLKLVLEKTPLSKHDETKKQVQSDASTTQIIFIIIYSVVFFMVILLHLHLAGYWPYTWTMTFFPLLLCTGTSVFVFGCCFPCIVTCLDCVLPRESFDKFNLDMDMLNATSNTTNFSSENKTIYPFGYGFAPVQGLIKFK